MSILVIGGMGFIGSRIVRSLVELGQDIVVVGRQPTLHRLGEVAEKIKVVQGDKTNIDQVFDWINTYKVSKIIDASSELEAESERVPYSATKINLIGTLNVFEAARITGIKRVVWASSLAVYGDKKRAGGVPQNEDALNNPVTVYGACKTYGEFMAKVYNVRWDMDIVSLRPSSVYGPLRASGATSWLTDVVKLPLMGEIVEIPVGPDETTNFCFVDDCAEAFVRLIARRCDISDAEIARVAAGPDAPGWSAADAAVIRAADELHADQMIGDATWGELAKTWNRKQLMDLVFTIGQYHLVAMALNSFGVQRDPGVPPLP